MGDNTHEKPPRPDPNAPVGEQIHALDRRIAFLIDNLFPPEDQGQEENPVIKRLEQVEAALGRLQSEVSQLKWSMSSKETRSGFTHKNKGNI